VNRDSDVDTCPISPLIVKAMDLLIPTPEEERHKADVDDIHEAVEQDMELTRIVEVTSL
jgi:hypothetical protein